MEVRPEGVGGGLASDRVRFFSGAILFSPWRWASFFQGVFHGPWLGGWAVELPCVLGLFLKARTQGYVFKHAIWLHFAIRFWCSAVFLHECGPPPPPHTCMLPPTDTHAHAWKMIRSEAGSYPPAFEGTHSHLGAVIVSIAHNHGNLSKKCGLPFSTRDAHGNCRVHSVDVWRHDGYQTVFWGLFTRLPVSPPPFLPLRAQDYLQKCLQL